MQTAIDCVIVMDRDGTVIEFNAAAERTFGYTREEAIGSELAGLIIPPPARRAHRRALAREPIGRASRVLDRRLEVNAMRADGSEFPVELTVTRVPESDPPLFVGYVRDITERRRHERELQRSLRSERAARSDAEEGRSAARRLIAQALGTEERERQQLARQLHDGPVQELLAAQLELRAAAAGEPGTLESAQAAIAHAVEQLRGAIFDLYPPVLERVGLAPAVEQLAGELSRRATADIHLDLTAESVGAHDRLLFSLARELLSNAVRHSEAENVHVELSRENGQVRLEVRDDGVGMTESERREALRAGHIGLASCAERVEAVGGSFSIASGEQGTLIRALLPARRAADRPGAPDEPRAAEPGSAALAHERRRLRT